MFPFFCFYPCCCKASQVSLNTRQLVILQKTSLTKPKPSFHFCFLFIWIKVTFFLYQNSKSKGKGKNMLMLYSMFPFYENYTAFCKGNPCQTNKTKQFFNFFNLEFSTILLKIKWTINFHGMKFSLRLRV